jgi:hypothetical protein
MQQFASRSGGKDLPPATKNCRILYQADLLKVASAPRRSPSTQGKKLANVGQKQVGGGRVFGQAKILQLWHCEKERRQIKPRNPRNNVCLAACFRQLL